MPADGALSEAVKTCDLTMEGFFPCHSLSNTYVTAALCVLHRKRN